MMLTPRVFAFGLSLLVAAPASAFSINLSTSGEIVHWAEPNVPYFIQFAGSDNLSPQETMTALIQSFQTWAELECSTITFTEMGDAPNPNIVTLAGSAPNGKSEIVWIEDSVWAYGSSVLGVTAPIISIDGVLSEADIAFNGFLVDWRVEDSGSETDLVSVAVHEIGHMIGIQHNLGPFSFKNPPTMAPSVAKQNKNRTLEADDIAVGCFLYPADGEWTCETDDDCPEVVSKGADGEYYSGEFICGEDNHCEDGGFFKNGTSSLGEECDTDLACIGNFYCQSWQESAVCSHYCLSDTPECYPGYGCEPFDDFPSYGSCLALDGKILKPGTGPAGCVSSDVCQTGTFCLPVPKGGKKSCTTTCEVADPDSCPEGEGCWSYGNPNGACFALEEWPEDGVEPGPDTGDTAEEIAEVGPEVSPEVPEELVAPIDIGGEGDASGGPDASEEVIDATIETDLTTKPPVPDDDGCQGGPGSTWPLAVAMGLVYVGRRRRLRHSRVVQG